MSEFWNVVALHLALGQVVMAAPASINEADARREAAEAKSKAHFRHVTIFSPNGDSELA